MKFANTLPLVDSGSTGKSRTAIDLQQLKVSGTAQLLFLAPHPDDFDSVGVTLKRFSSNGNDIRLVVLTGGAAGVLDSFVSPPSNDRKADVREREQKDSLRFFGLPLESASFPRLTEADDGELLVDEACRQTVAGILRDVEPDLVFVPHREDTNSGHRRTCALFRELASTFTKPTLALYHKDPKTTGIRIDVYTPFSNEEAEWKRKLLRHHRSQHTRNLQTRGSGFDDRILTVNEAVARDLGIVEPFAEGFQVELFGPAS